MPVGVGSPKVPGHGPEAEPVGRVHPVLACPRLQMPVVMRVQWAGLMRT